MQHLNGESKIAPASVGDKYPIRLALKGHFPDWDNVRVQALKKIQSQSLIGATSAAAVRRRLKAKLQKCLRQQTGSAVSEIDAPGRLAPLRFLGQVDLIFQRKHRLCWLFVNLGTSEMVDSRNPQLLTAESWWREEREQRAVSPKAHCHFYEWPDRLDKTGVESVGVLLSWHPLLEVSKMVLHVCPHRVHVLDVKQSNAKSILSLGSSWGWNNRSPDIWLCWGTSWARG